MSAGFTPGPWKVAASDKHRVIVDGGESAGLDIAGAIKFVPQYQSKSIANARLIAAAPELYEALDEYLHAVSRSATAIAAEKAKAALAKARGQ